MTRSDDRREAGDLELHVLPPEPRQVQEVVDEQPHLAGAVAHPAQIVARLVGQLAAVLVDQQLGEAVDAPQRRAQVVGHRVGERLELLVRGFQLRGPLADAPLELLGQPLVSLVAGFHLRFAHLDPRQHFVEGVDEQPELVVRPGGWHPDRVVLFLRHRPAASASRATGRVMLRWIPRAANSATQHRQARGRPPRSGRSAPRRRTARRGCRRDARCRAARPRRRSDDPGPSGARPESVAGEGRERLAVRAADGGAEIMF